MKRRNKEDMASMKDLVEFYLQFNENNPHKAYDSYIKEHLLEGKQFPYFINGLNDFTKVATQIADRKQIKEVEEVKKESEETRHNFLITRYKDDTEGLKIKLREYKGTSTYKYLVEFWMLLQEEKPVINSGLYHSLRDVLY